MIQLKEVRAYIERTDTESNKDPLSSWFSLPVEEEELKEKLGIDFFSQNYKISEIDVPMKVPPDINLYTLNWICKTVLELPREYQEELPTLLQYFDDIYAILYASNRIQYYEHCNNMADVARAYLKDVPWFSGLAENVKQYFDYEGFGEQLQSESRYVLGENGIFCFS